MKKTYPLLSVLDTTMVDQREVFLSLHILVTVPTVTQLVHALRFVAVALPSVASSCSVMITAGTEEEVSTTRSEIRSSSDRTSK